MRTMTAADLCDECELTGQTATTVLVPPFDSYEKEDPCPNCRHQTPAERVVEAADLCDECGVNPSDPPSRLCPGCDAYRDHTA